MLNLSRLILTSLLLTCICTTGAKAEGVALGIWSWKRETIETKTARTELLAFCEAQGIKRVDQHVSINRDDGMLQIRDANKLVKLIEEAASKNISITALRGDRKMFVATNHDARLAEVSAFVELNDALPAGVSLRGIKYDVEPYLTDEWKAGGESRETMMRDYLECLAKMRRLLKKRGSSLLLTVDVPFWWDKPELELEVDGVRKAFVNHIQDRVDAISIMSYRRAAKDVLRLSGQELDYAKAAGQKNAVAVGLNFRPATGTEKITTFAGHPVAEFHSTLSALKENLSDTSHVQCIMLHDYRALAKYVAQDAE